jgi:hypothetical protein
MANPLAAYQSAFDHVSGLADEARQNMFARKAGNALASGDPAAAANVMYRGGYLSAGSDLQQQAARAQQAQQQQADAQRKRQAEGAQNIARGMRSLMQQGMDPNAAYEQAMKYAPALGLDPADLEKMRPYFQQNPKGFVDFIDQQAAKELEIVKGSDGSYSAVDKATGRPVVQYQAPTQDKYVPVDPEKDVYRQPGRLGGVVGQGIVAPSPPGPPPGYVGRPEITPIVPSNYTPEDRDALARMIATEAGGEGQQGMLAAGAVAMNRLKSGYGGAKTLSDVINAPNQFEGMSRAGQVSPQAYQAALQVADRLLSGQASDPTGGAVNFINPQLQAQLGRQQPAWAPAGQGQRIGNHVFYGGQGQGENQVQGGSGSDAVMTSNPGAPEGLQLVRKAQAKPENAKTATRPATAQEKAAYGIPADVPAQITNGKMDVISGIAARTRAIPAKVQQGYIENNANIRQIDQAIAALRANPHAMGMMNMLGDEIRQRTDQGGIKTRAAVANVGAVKIHDLSGAAVTAAETPRLKPFIPMPTDTAAAAIQKLEQLKEQIANSNAQIEVQFGEESGYMPLRGAAQPARSPAASRAAPRAAAPAKRPPLSAFQR